MILYSQTVITNAMGKLITKSCYVCGADFSYYPREGYKNIVCSRKCNGIHQKNIGNQPPTYTGAEHPSWKGGRHIAMVHGRTPYWRITVGEKRYFEHRYLMEKKLGRKLKTTEVVHHKDHDSLNNGLDNLQLMSWSEHTLHHHTGAKYKK